MTQYIAPKADETRKAYIHRAYGIGKGAGKGRISAEGHEAVNRAIDHGHVFIDLLAAASAPKVKTPKAPSKAKPSISKEERADFAGIDPAHIREWAKANGIPVSERGRIANDVTIRYAKEVPAHEREARANGGKDLRQGAPRVRDEATTYVAHFTHRGEATTLKLSERTACGNCRYSLAWCGCDRPFVSVGYNDGPVRLVITSPNGA